MKRNKIAILLALTLSTGLLASCNQKTDPAATTEPATKAETAAETTKPETNAPEAPATTGEDMTIRVAWWGNQVRNDGTVAVLDLYASENPNVKFETEFTDWTGYWDKTATQAAAGSLPDIMQQDYAYIKQYQGKGQLASLTPFVSSGVLKLDDVSDGIIQSGTINNELYALCIGINAPSMLYDKEAAAAAGVTFEDGITREEFLEKAKAIYDATGLQYQWGYYAGENQIAFDVRGKGKVLFEDGKLGIDDPSEVLSHFKMYEDGIKSGVHTSAEDCNASVGVGIELSPFVLGKEFMSLSYSNQLVAFSAAANKELGITTWPVGADDVQKAMYLKPGQFFSITSTSKNQEEAAKVLNFFTNSVPANEILLAERGVPISASVAESIKDKMSESNKLVFDYIARIEPLCSPINPPSPEGMGEVMSLINTLVEQVSYGQMTAEQASEKFFKDGNDILAKAAQ